MLDKRGGSHRQKAGGAPRGGRSRGLQSYKTRVRIPHSTLISDVCLPLSVWGRGGGRCGKRIEPLLICSDPCAEDPSKYSLHNALKMTLK